MESNSKPAHLHTTHNANNTTVFLTGFGKFGNHETNPTEEVVRSITQQDKQKFGIQ